MWRQVHPVTRRSGKALDDTVARELCQDAQVTGHPGELASGRHAGHEVSVIVPVYNVAERLAASVSSALILPQVREVILVEDGSTDESVAICRELEAKHSAVKIVTHPNGENRGAGASRNLGVKHATCPFIAFLDADDRYLPNRFEDDLPILAADPTVDGVYGAIANEYESNELRQQWLAQRRPEFLTVSEAVPPDELLYVLLGTHRTVKGGFCTDTITIRKDTFNRLGGFHPKLRLQQDTHLWHRLAAFSKVVAGNISTPIAIRVVHPGNRVTRLADHELYFDLWWSSLEKIFVDNGLSKKAMQEFRRSRSLFYLQRTGRRRALSSLAVWVMREPSALLEEYEHFDIAMFDIFSRNPAVVRAISTKNRLVRALRGGQGRSMRRDTYPDR
jgi:glycosyltransferase involved in cell wall biosynthesis